jgi:cytochrome c-type biogenesis protein CcmH
MASPAPDTLPNTRDELRARTLQKEFRCLVCQGESLDDSNAPLAAELRHVIRQRIVAGDSDEQITQYLVARYGDFILMRPPLERQTYALWLAPIVALTMAGAVAMWVVTAARRRAGQP